MNLNFTSNASLLITWSPPAYYSNDVTIEFYTYEVAVTYAKAFSLDVVVNTTTLELANITMCDTFNVSVTAFLGKYRSIASKSHNGSECILVALIQNKLYLNFANLPMYVEFFM